MDVRVGFASDGNGDLYAAWPTDNRDFDAFLFQRADVYVGHAITATCERLDRSPFGLYNLARWRMGMVSERVRKRESDVSGQSPNKNLPKRKR